MVYLIPGFDLFGAGHECQEIKLIIDQNEEMYTVNESANF